MASMLVPNPKGIVGPARPLPSAIDRRLFSGAPLNRCVLVHKVFRAESYANASAFCHNRVTAGTKDPNMTVFVWRENPLDGFNPSAVTQAELTTAPGVAGWTTKVIVTEAPFVSEPGAQLSSPFVLRQ